MPEILQEYQEQVRYMIYGMINCLRKNMIILTLAVYGPGSLGIA